MGALTEREDMFGTFWVDPDLSVNGGTDGRIVFSWAPSIQWLHSPDDFYPVPDEGTRISLLESREWIISQGHTITTTSSIDHLDFDITCGANSGCTSIAEYDWTAYCPCGESVSAPLCADHRDQYDNQLEVLILLGGVVSLPTCCGDPYAALDYRYDFKSLEI